MRISKWKEGNDQTERLSVYFGGGLVEGNHYCGVVCALKIREVISFSMEKEEDLYLTEVMTWIRIDMNFN